MPKCFLELCSPTAFPFLWKEGEQGQLIDANDLQWSSQLSLDQESWEIPAAETCCLLAEQRAPGEGRAGSAVLRALSRGRATQPSTTAWAGTEAAGEGLVPTAAAELPALELQVQQGELQSRGCQATTGIISSPRLPPFLSSPSSIPRVVRRPCDAGGVSATEARGKSTRPPHLPFPPSSPGGRLRPEERDGEAEAPERHTPAERCRGREAQGRQAATW